MTTSRFNVDNEGGLLIEFMVIMLLLVVASAAFGYGLTVLYNRSSERREA